MILVFVYFNIHTFSVRFCYIKLALHFSRWRVISISCSIHCNVIRQNCRSSSQIFLRLVEFAITLFCQFQYLNVPSFFFPFFSFRRKFSFIVMVNIPPPRTSYIRDRLSMYRCSSTKSNRFARFWVTLWYIHISEACLIFFCIRALLFATQTTCITRTFSNLLGKPYY